MSYGTIPENATIRLEYVKCSNPDCDKKHGPYNYAYWKDKETKKLKKKYIGKSWEDYNERRTGKWGCACGYRPTLSVNKKNRFITREIVRGNEFAKEYNKKINENKVSVEWAYRKIKTKVMNDKLEKIAKRMDACSLAHNEPVNSDPKVRRTAALLLANYMKGCGLDWTDEQAIDNFLNSKELPKLKT